MAKLAWDVIGERKYETGVDHGVLFPMDNDGSYETGVAWSGLTSVDESPSGGDVNKVYADNIDYLALVSVEEFGYTINAYYSPDEFDECDGTKELFPGVIIGQQDRKKFGFAYRTLIGTDTDGTSAGYKIHLVYNSLAAPSQRTASTVNDSPEAQELSWECSTTKVNVATPGFKPTACLIIDSTKTPASVLTAIENAIYGTENSDPTLLLPDDIYDLYTKSTTPDPELPSDGDQEPPSDGDPEPSNP